MRALILSGVALLALECLGYAQEQPGGTLRGVYGPSGLKPPATPGKSTGKATLSAPGYGAIGAGPRVTIIGKPAQGETLPSDVNPAPISDRPGYGTAIVNGKRAIIDMSNNRIVQVLD
jgi:hypothetical protein